MSDQLLYIIFSLSRIIALSFFACFSCYTTKGQEVEKYDTIISIVRSYCVNPDLKDTLVIREGMMIDLGKVHFYTKIVKLGDSVHIRNYTEEIHKEGSEWITNLIPEKSCDILLVDFISRLNNELQHCITHQNRKDSRWSYEILMAKYHNQIILDTFGLNFISFIDGIRPIKNIECYFCKKDITWKQVTTLTERYESGKIEYDTLISETYTCPNGDFKTFTTKNTRAGKRDWSGVISTILQVTLDTSNNITTLMFKSDDSTISYSRSFSGLKYSYNITYDSEWKTTFFQFFKNKRKDNYQSLSIFGLSASAGEDLPPQYDECVVKNFLWIRQFIYYSKNGLKVPEPDFKRKMIFNKRKSYENHDGEWILRWVELYKKKKMIKRKEYEVAGDQRYQTLFRYDANDRVVEELEYDQKELVKKTIYLYKEEKR
jgi:hypothetical protein